jgi:hypothetical protein
MKSRPALFSFALHLVLLLLAAWLIRGKPSSGLGGEPLRRTAIVLATQPAAERTEYVAEPETPVTEPVPDPAPADPIPELPAAEAEPASSSAAAAPSAEIEQFDAGAMSQAATGANNDLEAAFSAADLEQIAREQRELAGQGQPPPPATTSVFGSGPLTGTRFVFLLDRSRSMGSGGLGVIGRARDELDKALAGLDERHCFQIVAYHQNTVMVDRRDMLPVTRENRRLAADFVDHLAAFGATNHNNALYSGLALMPDVIVLLSDGGFPTLHDGEIAALLKANHAGATIHCVEFGTSDIAPAGSFMERLALRAGGTYRYVDVKQWRRE